MRNILLQCIQDVIETLESEQKLNILASLAKIEKDEDFGSERVELIQRVTIASPGNPAHSLAPIRSGFNPDRLEY